MTFNVVEVILNNHNYNKIFKSDWLSTVLISALIGQCQGGKSPGLGPRNDVLTTCKAVTLSDGQRIIAVFFPQ